MAVMPKSVHRKHAPGRLRRSQRGFTLIDLMMVLGLIGLLMSFAIPFMARARGRAVSTSAVGTLRVVNSAQLSFAISCGLGFYAPDLPALGQGPPNSVGFLAPDMASAASVIRTGYSFTLAGTPLAGTPGTCNGLAQGQSAPGYIAIADPLDPQVAARYFGTNSDGIIYEHTVSMNGLIPESGSPIAGQPTK